jgi:hypothetical protein
MVSRLSVELPSKEYESSWMILGLQGEGKRSGCRINS